MKPVWFLTLLIVQTAICDHARTIHTIKTWRNIRRERMCLTSRGKMGICLQPKFCTGYVSNSILSTEKNECHCSTVNGNPIVCCPFTRRWLYDRLMPSNYPDTLVIASGVITGNSRFYNFIRHLSTLSSYGNSKLIPMSSAGMIKDTSVSKFMRYVSNELSSSIASKPASTASATLLRYKRSYASTGSHESVLITPEEEPSELTLSTNNNSSTTSSDSLSSPNASDKSSTEIPITPKVIEVDVASAFPEPPVCGISQGTFSRVVGGHNASIGDFPWIGVVAYRTVRGFVFKCGASLITSQHSLTAAHCIIGFEDSLYFVRFGELDLADHNQTRPVDVLVKKMIKHEKYNPKDSTSDIGILVLHRKVVFTNVIRPICLPLSEELRSNNFVGYNPFIAGWGQIRYKGPAATRLQMLQLPVTSQARCGDAYAPLKVFVIDQRVICAGGAGDKDACYGDSGGPLMQPIWDPVNYTTYFYQTGVVSFGMKCGTPGFPAVFTRITEYMPWIQKHVLGAASA